MQRDLASLLPSLLPRAIAWAEAVAADAAAAGTALGTSDLAIARAAGVRKPDDIRVLMVDALPLPPDPELLAAALLAGQLGPA